MTARDHNGFTLVELLVATTLLALLSVVLFGGLRFGARAWEVVTMTEGNPIKPTTPDPDRAAMRAGVRGHPRAGGPTTDGCRHARRRRLAPAFLRRLVNPVRRSAR